MNSGHCAFKIALIHSLSRSTPFLSLSLPLFLLYTLIASRHTITHEYTLTVFATTSIPTADETQLSDAIKMQIRYSVVSMVYTESNYSTETKCPL